MTSEDYSRWKIEDMMKKIGILDNLKIKYLPRSKSNV